MSEPTTTGTRQIQRAKELEAQRQELMEKITKNRDFLRLLDGNEELTPDEGAWLDTFYPLKEKGEQRTKEEVEATRKLKEEAVKEIREAAKPAKPAAVKPAAKEKDAA